MSSLNANPTSMRTTGTPMDGKPPAGGQRDPHPMLRAILEVPALLLGVILLDSLTATRPIYHLLETWFGQRPEMPLFWLAQLCLVGVAGVWVLRVIEEPPTGADRLRRAVSEIGTCAAAIFMCGFITHDLLNWRGPVWVVLPWLAMASFWIVPSLVRRERTSALLDAILLALLYRLSVDAVYYLMHGDMRWKAWHRWYGTDLDYTMVFVATTCALLWPMVLLSRRIKHSVARWSVVVGSLLTFAGASQLFLPGLAVN